MALDRGRMAKIDRRLFAELDQSRGVQMVKVPVSDAVWSTWRRYCELLQLSMGEGLAGLILDELEVVIDDEGATAGTYAEIISRQVAEDRAGVEARQRALDR